MTISLLADSLRDSLIGDSPPMRQLRLMIARVARADVPVLIQGPTGSGKELVANAVHGLSGRSGRLVAVNVCAIGDSVFEDALFGHVRGAFTGAISDSRGYLAEADRGTLFLDEISGLPLSLQPKLLRALETKTFRPVGAAHDRRSDFRVVGASNLDIRAAVASGAFRADLRFRLGAVVLEVPALSDRLEDIPALIAHFIEHSGSSSPESSSLLKPQALGALSRHDWPGNVRELRNAVDHLLLFCGSRSVTGADVASAIGLQSPIRVGRRGFMERRLITVLEEVEWNIPAAATTLGVDRTTVYRWLRQLDVGHLRASSSPRPRRTTDGNPVADRTVTTESSDGTIRHNGHPRGA